jgi:hypothetical protein
MKAISGRLWVTFTIGAAGLIIAGSVLPWLEPSVDAISSASTSFQTPSFAGVDLVLGLITLGVGLVGLCAAVAGRRFPRFGALVVLLSGFVGLGVALWLLLDTSSAYVTAATSELATEDLSSTAIRSSLESPLARGLIAVEAQLGVWILLTGSALGLIVGAVWMVGAGRGRPTDVGEAERSAADRLVVETTAVSRGAPGATLLEASPVSSDEQAKSTTDEPDEMDDANGNLDAGTRRRRDTLGDSWAG